MQYGSVVVYWEALIISQKFVTAERTTWREGHLFADITQCFHRDIEKTYLSFYIKCIYFNIKESLFITINVIFQIHTHIC